MVGELLPVPTGGRHLAWWDRAQPPKYLHRHEVHRVLDATKTPRNRLLVNTLWTTGARIGESLLIRPCDFDQTAGVVRVKTFKTRKAKKEFDRAVTLCDEVLKTTPNSARAHHTRGIASACLALLSGRRGADVEERAKEDHRTAIAINPAVGMVRRILRLYDALQSVDRDGILTRVRQAVAMQEAGIE